jgi:hypothetical protein
MKPAIGRPQPPGDYLPVWAIVLIVALLLAAMIAWNQYTYGDWSCAFSRCTKVF